MTIFAKAAATLIAAPLIVFAGAQQASAVLLQYSYSATGDFSAGGFPNVGGLDFSFIATVDTATDSVTDFEFTFETIGTWSGTGGTAAFETQDLGPGFVRQQLELNVGTEAGATYDAIAVGFTPAIAEVNLVGPFGDTPAGFDDFVDGFPTTIDLTVGFATAEAVFLDSTLSVGAFTNDFTSVDVFAQVPTEPVPEPVTVVGTLVAAGVGALMKHRRRQAQNAD